MTVATPRHTRHRRAPRWFVAGWLLWSTGGATCSGTPEFDGHTYRDTETEFRISTPGQGWEPVSVEGQNDLAWFHESLAALIQVNASCDPALDIPLRSLVQQLLIGFTDREFRDENTVPMDQREALRSHLMAKLDGVPRELMLQVLKKDGCVYDFSLVAPPDTPFDRALRSYDRVVNAFQTRKRQ